MHFVFLFAIGALLAHAEQGLATQNAKLRATNRALKQALKEMMVGDDFGPGDGGGILDSALSAEVNDESESAVAVYGRVHEKFRSMGSGKCQTTAGEDPVYKYNPNEPHVGNGFDECSQACVDNEFCFGFSVSTYSNCLHWLQEDIMGGGDEWGGAECYIKRFEYHTEDSARDTASVCPGVGMKGADLDACKSVAKELEITLVELPESVHDDDKYPKGCYYKPNKNAIYFNAGGDNFKWSVLQHGYSEDKHYTKMVCVPPELCGEWLWSETGDDRAGCNPCTECWTAELTSCTAVSDATCEAPCANVEADEWDCSTIDPKDDCAYGIYPKKCKTTCCEAMNSCKQTKCEDCTSAMWKINGKDKRTCDWVGGACQPILNPATASWRDLTSTSKCPPVGQDAT